MILRELPHLQLASPTRSGDAFRRWFYARWGRENAIILGRAARADFPLYTQALSIKRAWGGREDYLLPGRELAVDDDHYLVLNDGARYGSRIACGRAMTSLGVFFRPGLAQEVAAAMRQDAVQALDEPRPAPPGVGFAEHLRPARDDPRLAAALARLRDDVLAGEDDDGWLEERLQHLAALMLQAEPGWRARSQRLAGLSRSSHAELLGRVDRAADFILSCHAQPISLDDVAQAARLSKYHLVRAFHAVHGETPMALLARTRVHAARRLLADPALSLEDVAALSGFGSRQTLFRQLRRHCGDGGRGLRERAARPHATPTE